MIRRKRKVVNGVEITLLEKDVSRNLDTDFSSLYANLESKLKQHLTSELHSLPKQVSSATTNQIETIVTELSADGLLSGSSRLDTPTFLNLVSNEPVEGDLLSYDDTNDKLNWVQGPGLRLAEIENTLTNYQFEFTSDHILPNKLHLPFAVKWSVPPYHEWGGFGKAGIFWTDPWAPPVDNYSIKMGGDNDDIGETGYSNYFPITVFSASSTAGTLSVINQEVTASLGSYPYDYMDSRAMKVGGGSPGGLVQRFANDSSPNRGWAWTRFGITPNLEPSAQPWVVASLTNDGQFNVEGSLISRKYSSPFYDEYLQNPLEKNRGDAVGALHVDGYKHALSNIGWSGQSIISIGNSDLTKDQEGWVLTYEHHYPESSPSWADEDAGIIVSLPTGTPGLEDGYTATTTPVGHMVLRPPEGGALSALTDVQITTPTPNGDALIYNTSLGKWVNGAGGGGGGGTLPGVEIDMGAFIVLDQPAEIDAGSFV